MRFYRHGGVEALENRDGWTKYPKEFKIYTVHDVLEGRKSLMGAILKYNISGKRVLVRWIANYNGHREQKTFLKESSSMNQGRSTNPIGSRTNNSIVGFESMKRMVQTQ